MAENSTHTTESERCYKHVAPNPPPIIRNGTLHIQTHHIGFIISGVFALIASIVSFWLISKHLQWYHNKREQRYIVRLLFMVPLYAIISFASFFFWNQATPIVLIRDAYEAIVLTAFFYLLLMYISHDPEEQKRVFLKKGLSKQADRNAIQRGVPLEKWCFPLGFIKWKPSDGLYFLQLMKWAVLQYCVVRPLSTLAAVILDSVGLYCEASWGLGWGHIWLLLIISISVTIAMYCLIQLYVAVSEELAPHQPLLKLFSVKAVVFLTFWQATLLSVLAMLGVIKATQYMTVEDINIGIGAVLETVEMAIFAFLHLKAFTYKPYKQIAIKAARRGKPERTPQWRALGHALDYRETFREIWVGCKYMIAKMRGKEPKYDRHAHRNAHYEVAFGRSRFQSPQSELLHERKEKGEKQSDTLGCATLPVVEIEVDQETEVEIEGQRQWLGLGKHERYGLHPQREKSEGLEAQINQELERRGIPKLSDEDWVRQQEEYIPRKPTPWWRSLYNRISHSGQESEGGSRGIERESFLRSPTSKSKRVSRRLSKIQTRNDSRLPEELPSSMDDQPPPSILFPSSKFRPPRSPTYAHDPDSPPPHISQLDEDLQPMLPLAYVTDGFTRVKTGRNDPTSISRYPRLQGSPSTEARPPSRNRSPQDDSRSPPPRHSGYNRAGIGAVYHDPFDASGPMHPRAPQSQRPQKKHAKPESRERKPVALPSARQPPRSWYVPPRESLVFPAALAPQHRALEPQPTHAPSRSNGAFGRSYQWTPSSPKPGFHSHTNAPNRQRDERSPDPSPKRRSTHRREAANPPLSPQSPQRPQLPFGSDSIPSPLPTVPYTGLPPPLTGTPLGHSPFNDPYEPR